MKKTLFILITILSIHYAHAQNTPWSTTSSIGIGTTTPNGTLQVTGTFITAGNNSNLDNRNGNLGLTFLANSAQMLTGWNRGGGSGEIDFIANQGAGDVGGYAFYNHDNSNNENMLMWILGNGQVLIGNTQGKQGNYLLAVAGSAVATSFTVKAVANWPDYVFKRSYHLPELSALKTFIDQNHHLPEIPSEKEIATDGLNLGDIDRLLTKKVEELTLYLIDKDKEVKEQRQELEAQKKINQNQQAEIDQLRSQIINISKQMTEQKK